MAFEWLFPVVGEAEYSGGSWMPDSHTHRGRTHPAIDIYAAHGAPIIAPVGGVVQTVRSSDIGGYTVTIKGDDGYTYYFAHMAAMSPLEKGQRIGQGGYIGAVGNSGSAKRTSPHLHLKMSKNGTAVNPKRFLDHGYRVPEVSQQAATAEQPLYEPAYGINFTDPFQVAENIAFHAEDEPQQQPSQLTAEQFLAYSMDAVSNMAAGGQREDYRLVGQVNVPALDLQVKRAVDEGPMDEGEQL